MKKTILITGSTDGIGFETAKMLAEEGHKVLIHGRNTEKLKNVKNIILQKANSENIECYVADLSEINEVKNLAEKIKQKHNNIDILINNAGVYKVDNTRTKDNLEVRFAVNTIAPYLLTKLLMPLFDKTSRVVNLSSAAQSPVNLEALKGEEELFSFGEAYAQSKLAITMWSFSLAKKLEDKGPSIIAVNPKSLLGSKMVKEAYGINGANLKIGADILYRASLSDEFNNANGKYFDNDIGKFASPHPDAEDIKKCQKLEDTTEKLIMKYLKEKK